MHRVVNASLCHSKYKIYNNAPFSCETNFKCLPIYDIPLLNSNNNNTHYRQYAFHEDMYQALNVFRNTYNV